MELALKKHCLPVLRKKGFKGSFPNFYREKNKFVALINFQFYSSGGSFCVNLGYADPERKNVNFKPDKYNAANKLKVSSTRARRRLGAPIGDNWFSFGTTSYNEYRGDPKPVDEIALTCCQLFLDDAEPWWKSKEIEEAE